MRLRKNSSGQSLTESVLLMPMFLTMAFALIQIGHIGIGVLLVNYGASTAARMAVEENDPGASHGQDRFNKLLMGGLTSVGLVHSIDSSNPITPNITVTACAQLPAYPFVGQFLKTAFKTEMTEGGCQQNGSFVSLVGPAPYHFIVRGQATARMNYAPHPGG